MSIENILTFMVNTTVYVHYNGEIWKNYSKCHIQKMIDTFVEECHILV